MDFWGLIERARFQGEQLLKEVRAEKKREEKVFNQAINEAGKHDVYIPPSIQYLDLLRRGH